MSTPAQVYAALIDVLQSSATLSYISDNAILLGMRERFDNFPCLVIEEGTTADEEIDINGYVDLRMNTSINALVQVTNVDKQIVGDTTTKGTADIVNDIKTAICADRTLGGVVIDCTFKEVINSVDEWPVRVAAIGIEILYRQNSTTRT